MKPYTVIMEVRPIETDLRLPGEFEPSRPIPVYAYDEAEAVIRATRLLNMDDIEVREHVSVTEGWT